MEHTLLRPRNLTLGCEGLPYLRIEHLLVHKGHHDANLRMGFGSDEEIEEINRMEAALGALSQPQIAMRVMADFCCIWRYDYPRRVHDICAAIGGSPHTAFRLHYQVCTERRQEFIDYAKALQCWIDERGPDVGASPPGKACDAVEKVYRMLGSKDPLKKMLVERTCLGLSARVLNCSFWGHNEREAQTALTPRHAQQLSRGWSGTLRSLEQKIRTEMGSAAGDFLCDVGGSAEPACHFKFMRRVDILVSSIGCLRWRGSLPPKDAVISGRRQITRQYLEALEEYWNGTGASRSALAQELHRLLGSRTDFKRWLVASLWKGIKNQTLYQAYPMQRWVEFVRSSEDWLDSIDGAAHL